MTGVSCWFDYCDLGATGRGQQVEADSAETSPSDCDIPVGYRVRVFAAGDAQINFAATKRRSK